ncbi:RICIN domain-containing protein [Paractinoplanes lichenicola]|uniref:Ricin-type beta-trefoil lectin domain protein n=1 Tax=Paractinoplanes lichenicola TaxID=2802976 RepID=A0ABS1W4M3_9ACTN|nr:RICIN domain-containing protein [Actinoplanes lichenicola]MBL7261638.1 ricin-type beta-trefoil lectin domain protein [Actinoplanes lichenicola]
MTDGDQNGERDPLLVRPFVLRDSGTLDDDESTQTWPSTPDAAQHTSADAPTAILHLPFKRHAAAKPGTAGNHRRRLLVMASAATVVVLGAAAAGYAALRSEDVRPSVATEPGAEIPAAKAPLPTSAAVSPSISGTSTGQPGRTSSTSGVPSTSSSASASAGVSAPGVPPVATSPTPISLTPTSPGGGEKTAPTGGPQLVAPDPPSSDRTAVIRGQNGQCLDLNGAVAVDGNFVQTYECNNSVAQTWTLATDGTLRVMGKCALLVGGGAVEVTTCDGRTPAQWRASGQRLLSAVNNNCLTDPAGGRKSGSRVVVTDCTGSANQRWSLP